MGLRFGTLLLTSALIPAVLASGAWAQTASNADVTGTVVVSPLGGTGIDTAKVPASVQTLGSGDFDRTNSANALDALGQMATGVYLTDVQGNGFSQDLRFRGFAASPLQGTPQGIAVYQNGVRLNETFGDTVNWDLIPEIAIDRADIWTNNPVFGLNAIGGAVSLRMKSGFTWQGLEAEIQGGSYGRYGGSLQYGFNTDIYSFYLAVDGQHEDGWRPQSPADITRVYGDFGWRNDLTELHLIGSLASNKVGVVGPSPIELVNANRTAIFTWPQTTSDRTGSLVLNFHHEPLDDWAIDGDVHYRKFKQGHVDGNDGDFEGCSTRGNFGGALCEEDDGFLAPTGKPAAYRNQFTIFGPAGQTIPFVAGTPYGTIDRTWTDNDTFGGSIQLSNKSALFGHDNNFLVGVSVDSSDARFQSNSTLGVINTDLSVSPRAGIAGTGLVVHNVPTLQFGPQYAALIYQPIDLNAKRTDVGAFVADTFDITEALSATLALRFNSTNIDTSDSTGVSPELTSQNSFTRANPMVGLTYRFSDAVSIYGGYSESNRAPTPLELDCANPNRPCLLENSLVSDPVLKQAVSHTFELGLRGNSDLADGKINWDASLFRTETDDDIISLASVLPGRGYFANVPETLRQGVQLGARYKAENWSAYANYSYTVASYQFTGTLSSPNNPQSDANGDIFIRPGKIIPGIPAHQLKMGADYAPFSAWTIGGDVTVVGPQYYIGDDANQNSQLPSYWVASLHTSYQVTDQFEIFGRVDNLFDRQFATYGTYFETDSISFLKFTDARSITPALPRSFYAGVKFKM